MRPSEHRKSPRAPLDVYLNKVVGEDLFMCRATDISAEGIYLSSLIEPDWDGSRVALEFALPGSQEVIWAGGEVVRDGLRGQAEGAGIRFTALPDRYRRLIEDYVHTVH